MKFVKIDGVQYIVLEENDKICITTPAALSQKQKLEFKSNGEVLEFFGNSSVDKSIKNSNIISLSL